MDQVGALEAKPSAENLEHQFFKCPGTAPACIEGRCVYCSGGLAFCTVCKQAEGDLEPTCPGKQWTFGELREAYPDWNFEFSYGEYRATHDNFEASWEGEEDGWVGNGLHTSSKTVQGLYEELITLIEEHPHFNKEQKNAQA
jgi:hypothetical protein